MIGSLIPCEDSSSLLKILWHHKPFKRPLKSLVRFINTYGATGFMNCASCVVCLLLPRGSPISRLSFLPMMVRTLFVPMSRAEGTSALRRHGRAADRDPGPRPSRRPPAGRPGARILRGNSHGRLPRVDAISRGPFLCGATLVHGNMARSIAAPPLVSVSPERDSHV